MTFTVVDGVGVYFIVVSFSVLVKLCVMFDAIGVVILEVVETGRVVKETVVNTSFLVALDTDWVLGLTLEEATELEGSTVVWVLTLLVCCLVTLTDVDCSVELGTLGVVLELKEVVLPTVVNEVAEEDTLLFNVVVTFSVVLESL